MSKKILLAALTALPLLATATEYQVIDRPRQECWNEQVPVQSLGQDYSGAILGGIAGGLLGNQVGKGNGRTVATAAGAMAGAVTGDRMANNRPGYQNVQRCRTVVDHVRVPIQPEPMYLPAAPAYAPQPIYVQPQPVYLPPRPVVVQPAYGYYAVPIERDGERWRRWHHWREHHRHHDDDD